jgi:hypothetical protein
MANQRGHLTLKSPLKKISKYYGFILFEAVFIVGISLFFYAAKPPVPKSTQPTLARLLGPPVCSTSQQAPCAATDAQVPKHIATQVYDDSCQGYKTPSAFVQKWVSIALSSCNGNKALSDCHAHGVTYCLAFRYTSPVQIAPLLDTQGIMPSTRENWWLHDPGYKDKNHRITMIGNNGPVYSLNQSVPAVDDWFEQWARSKYNAWDGFEADDTYGNLPAQLYGSSGNYTTAQELTSDAALQAAHATFANAMTHVNHTPFLLEYNAIYDGGNEYIPQYLSMIHNPTNVIGLIADSSPWDYGNVDQFYSGLLDDIAYVNTQTKGFVALLSYDNTGNTAGRRVQEATTLLSYSQGHTVDWEEMLNPNQVTAATTADLSIWPEEGIYPTQPLETMQSPGGTGCLAGTGVLCSTGGHNDLQVALGVYRREFKQCYNQGIPFGPCAVIMNDTLSPVTIQSTWLKQTYTHVITMTGSDVESGGFINVHGHALNQHTDVIASDDAILMSH